MPCVPLDSQPTILMFQMALDWNKDPAVIQEHRINGLQNVIKPSATLKLLYNTSLWEVFTY